MIHVVRILVVLLMVFLGWYYFVNARRICRNMAESARRLKPPLSYLCPPARFYDSKFSVVTIRIGGCIALLIAALMVFVLIYFRDRM